MQAYAYIAQTPRGKLHVSVTTNLVAEMELNAMGIGYGVQPHDPPEWLLYSEGFPGLELAAQRATGWLRSGPTGLADLLNEANPARVPQVPPPLLPSDQTPIDVREQTRALLDWWIALDASLAEARSVAPLEEVR